MVPLTTSLTGFSGEAIWPLGQLRFLVIIGDVEDSTKAWMNFMIVNSLSQYNGVIRRLGIREIQAVPSTAHGMLKFLVDGEIVTIRMTILIPTECTVVTTMSKEILKEAEPSDITGVLRSIAEHRLNIQEGYPPVRHKKRGQASERARAIQVEIKELVRAGKLSYLIKEIKQGRDQLIVGKKEVPAKENSTAIYIVQSWHRMTRQKVTQSFARFKKITFPPLATSRGTEGPLIIEAEISGHIIHHMYVDGGSSMKVLYEHCFNRLRSEIKSQMVPLTTSLTGFSGEAIWPLGQLRIVILFQKLTGKLNLYVATLLSISWMLTKALTKYRWQNQMKRKWPSTPAIEAVEGMFFGYMISPEGIKPCLEKPKVMLRLPSPWTIKEVQILNWKLANLNKFLTKSAEKSLPLFKTLKKCIKKSDFHWTLEAEQAFKQLKQHLSELPMLVAPILKEELIVYRVITKIERHAGRTQYHLLAEDISERTYPSGFPFREAKRSSTSEGTKFTYALRFQFTASNNEAEYEKCIKKSDFHWTLEAEQAFKQLKQHFSELPMLVPPILKEELIVYRSASQRAISAVLMTERGTVQRPVYFVSRALQGPELNYTPMEKLVLALIFTAKRVIIKIERHAGRTQYHLLAEDICERTYPSGFPFREARRSSTSAGLILTSLEGTKFTYALRFQFTASNNEAEYEGIDIAGPFPEGPGKVKFLIVAMDYFTKWIEAKSVTTITGSQVKKFVWDNIVYRFGLRGKIVSDNGKQFSDNLFKDWCEKLNITQRFASVKHPQSNGLMERANRSLGEGIKALLGKGNKNWIEELPHVLWAHHTMIKSSYDNTLSS
nr:reverse transcriptase domain-containing protein [Tanacetum cinerariifolium]